VSIIKSLLSGTIAAVISLCVPAYSQDTQQPPTNPANPSTRPDRTQPMPDRTQPNQHDTSTMDQTANRSANGQSATGTPMKPAERKFVMDAAEGGMAEVELGKLAKDKGSSDGVKQFGQRMFDDHSKANDELKKIASSKTITLPDSLDAKHKATIDRLSKLSGADFDRAYIKEMVKDHEQDVKEFQRESQSGSDPEIKDFAAKTLPTLQDHLRQIKELESGKSSNPSTADRSKQ